MDQDQTEVVELEAASAEVVEGQVVDVAPEAKAPEKLCGDKTDIFFFIHMLFSCLTDADFLDTEKFMNGDLGRGGYAEIQELWEMLKKHVEPWKNAKNELNEKRNAILAAVAYAEEAERIFIRAGAKQDVELVLNRLRQKAGQALPSHQPG